MDKTLRCSICKEEKPTEDFHRCVSAATGYQSRCKACKQSLSRAYGERNKKRNLANGPAKIGSLICGGCKVEKPTSEFPKDVATRTGYSPYCKMCQRAANRRRRLQNKERNLANGPAEVSSLSCSGCKGVKPVSEFYKDSTTTTGYQDRCKPCQKVLAERQKISYREANEKKYQSESPAPEFIKCNKCGEEKPISEYNRMPTSKFGWDKRCKSCNRARIDDAKEVNRQRNRVPVIPASGLLDCSRCGQAKPVADFYISRASKRGWKSLCKSCSKDGITKEAKRKVALRPYGMEPEEYDARLSAQLGGCAICGNLDSIEGRSHPVDHCHDCGKVRGILCTLCNTGANWNSVPGWTQIARAYHAAHAAFEGCETARRLIA